MRVKALKEELDERGVQWKGVAFEKEELVRLLEEARTRPPAPPPASPPPTPATPPPSPPPPAADASPATDELDRILAPPHDFLMMLQRHKICRLRGYVYIFVNLRMKYKHCSIVFVLI